jgi:hypothetical protein
MGFTPFEYLGYFNTGLKTAGSVFKAGVWAYKKLRRPKIDPVALAKRRVELKKEFLRHMPLPDDYGICGELIIRDIERMDTYPNHDAQRKGISPWFGVELKGLYERGIEVHFGVRCLVKRDMYGDWKFTQFEGPDTRLAYPVARIPFDVIELVDWDGDDRYHCPHVYCQFSLIRKQPYEAFLFYSKIPGTETLQELKNLQPWDNKRGWFFRFGK